jgi:hypothetical protein
METVFETALVTIKLLRFKNMKAGAEDSLKVASRILSETLGKEEF